MPQFDASDHLTQHIKQLMSARTVSRADLIDIVRRCRLVLDQDKTKSSYPVLSLYCDWLQHDEIDRHPTGFEILEKIDGLSITHGSDMPRFIHSVSDAVGLALLRQELIRLFTSKNIPVGIFESLSNWMSFIRALLDDLARYRPIRFPADVAHNKKANGKTVYERMKHRRAAVGRRTDFVTCSLFLTDKSNEPGAPGRPPGFYWHIRLTPGEVAYAELNGNLQFTECAADFKLP